MAKRLKYIPDHLVDELKKDPPPEWALREIDALLDKIFDEKAEQEKENG